MRPPRVVLVAAFAAVVVTACAGATKTPFARAALDAGGTFAAAARTIDDLHAGRLTREYAAATLGVLATQVEAAPDELRTAAGASDPGSAAALADQARAGVSVVRSPCLDAGCDWRGQVAALRGTARALSEAGGS
ncbi:MAG TPA: hypothetical protein VFI28_08500 [Candidatus Limnocylindrales bacterium]|nr:hypothetical protein [Candidatus Limnocylindrales bacterium]